MRKVFRYLIIAALISPTIFLPTGFAANQQKAFATSSTYSFMDSTPGTNPNWASAGAAGLELGISASTTSVISISAVRFYKVSGSTQSHTANIWNSSGTRIATQAFTSETSVGWQEVVLNSPIAISSGSNFTVSVYSSNYYYPNQPFPSMTAGPVTIANGVYRYDDESFSGFPNNIYTVANGGIGSNYGVDFVFTPGQSTTPAAPTSLVASAGDGQATISFTPGYNGGSEITNYIYSLNGTNYLTLSPIDASSPVTIPGLTNGTTYNIYLKAVNSAGEGNASSSVSVTPVTTPAAPTSLVATPANGQATISFTPGSNGGSAITNYIYSLDGTNYLTLSPIDGSSPVTIPGLTNGTTYNIYLKAVNSAGEGNASSSVSVTPVAPTVSASDSSGPDNYFEPIRKVEVSNGKINWEPNRKVVISQYDPSSKKTTIIESTNGQLVLPKAKPGQSVSYSIMATDGTVLKKVTMKTKPNAPKIAKVASQKSQLLTINNKTAITAQWKKDKSVKKYNIKITLDNGKILAFTTTDPNINLVIDETKGATITITAIGKNNLTATVTRKI